MNLYSNYVKVFNNKVLDYLYKYDSEILYVKEKERACLIIYIGEQKYAIPFRSNMKHHEGKVFITKISKYGLDFTKAIPVYDDTLLLSKVFLLKDIEKKFYSKDENYMMISLKFEQYINLIYYEDKYHTTNHEILEYAQKYKLLLDTKTIKIFNHLQEEVDNFLNIINYEAMFKTLDEFYENIDKFKSNKTYANKLIKNLEETNKNIIIINLEEVDE